MKSALFFTSALAALCQLTTAAVVGEAEGFAAGVTGGAGGEEVTPTTIEELISYLKDDEPRIVNIAQTMDFTGSEGTTSGKGCAAWGTGSTCQTAINANDWCTNYQPDAPVINVKYDTAGPSAIRVGSNKSILGVKDKGVLIGKGLQMRGSKNVIIQNVHITSLNPQFVWGGDAITLNDSDLIWIDHVTTSLIGRQHIVLGEDACGRVTISNCKIDGSTDWSATCDGHHYWAMYFTGSQDMVTLKNNYIYHTSGRAPKVGGNTLLHAVNNYWENNSGHAFEIAEGGMVLAEGNLMNLIRSPVEDGYAGQLFSSPSAEANAVCEATMGRACEVNSLVESGPFEGLSSDFLANLKGKTVANADPVGVVEAVKKSAGFGLI